MRLVLRAILLASLLAVSNSAFAHPGHDGAPGVLHGFLHPFGGLDHVLAMVAVGLLAAQLGGRALWMVPAAFVTVMAAAGVAATAGVGLPYVEIGIAVSVIVIGGAMALARSMPVAFAMALVGFFAIFHGYAHGAEMPATASGLGYGLGFVAATSLLHLAGIALGLATGRIAQGRSIARLAGAAAAGVGAALLFTGA